MSKYNLSADDQSKAETIVRGVSRSLGVFNIMNNHSTGAFFGGIDQRHDGKFRLTLTETSEFDARSAAAAVLGAVAMAGKNAHSIKSHLHISEADGSSLEFGSSADLLMALNACTKEQTLKITVPGRQPS